MKKIIVVEAYSKDNMGIKFEGDNWVNPGWDGMGDADRTTLKKEFAEIGKGDKIELELLDNGKYTAITILEKGKGSFQDNIIHFEDLLKKAHEQGLMSIKTECISVSWKNKTAMFKAKVKMLKVEKHCKKERVFEAYGDATQDNIDSEKVKIHWIRMAETRAIARALRWATNSAECTDVETEKGDSEGEPTEEPSKEEFKKGKLVSEEKVE